MMKERILSKDSVDGFRCYYFKYDDNLPEDIIELFYDKENSMSIEDFDKMYRLDQSLDEKHVVYYYTKDHFDYKDLIYELCRYYMDDRRLFGSGMECPLDIWILKEPDSGTEITDLLPYPGGLIDITVLDDKELFKGMLKDRIDNIEIYF